MSADVLPMLSHCKVVPAPAVRIPSPAAVLSSAALAFEEAQVRADSRECDENNCPCRDLDVDDLPELGHYCERCVCCEDDRTDRRDMAEWYVAVAVVNAGLLVAVAQAGAR